MTSRATCLTCKALPSGRTIELPTSSLGAVFPDSADCWMHGAFAVLGPDLRYLMSILYILCHTRRAPYRMHNNDHLSSLRQICIREQRVLCNDAPSTVHLATCQCPRKGSSPMPLVSVESDMSRSELENDLQGRRPRRNHDDERHCELKEREISCPNGRSLSCP